MAFPKFNKGETPCKFCKIGNHSRCKKREDCSCNCPHVFVPIRFSNQNTYKMTCIRGHSLTEDNVYRTKTNVRLCKQCCSIRAKLNYQLHRDALIKHYYRNRDMILAKRKSVNIDKRLKIIYHYSDGMMCCKLCGLKGYEFLTIDHIHGGGNKQREELGTGGETFFNWVIKNNYPEGLQILCYNCNCVKSTHGLKRLLSLLEEEKMILELKEGGRNA